MGTFHQGKSELHGITVVVDTKGPEIFVGRCDDENEQVVILLDVDVHREGDGGRSKNEYVERAAQFGVWKKHDRMVIERTQVVSVKPLGEITSA
jgi:hypothetical protein